MRSSWITLLFLTLCMVGCGKEEERDVPEGTDTSAINRSQATTADIKFVAIDGSTGCKDNPALDLLEPSSSSVPTESVMFKFEVTDFDIGKNPTCENYPEAFPRFNGKPDDSNASTKAVEENRGEAGQYIEVVVDNGLKTVVTMKTNITMTLKGGGHAIRAYLCRPWNECIKDDDKQASIAKALIVKDGYQPLIGAQMVSISSPPLRFKEDGTQMIAAYKKGKVPFDFYIWNAHLGPGGLKERLKVTITKENGDQLPAQELTSWQPYYITGLDKGKYKITAQLLLHTGNPIGGDYAQMTVPFEVIP